MECIAPGLNVQLAAEDCVIDLGSLYARLARLEDKRHARGLRHALVTVLVYIVLAKLAGQDRVYGISQWAKHRQAALAEAFGSLRMSAPSVNTYRRVLANAIEIEELTLRGQLSGAQFPQGGISGLDGPQIEFRLERKMIKAGVSIEQFQFDIPA